MCLMSSACKDHILTDYLVLWLFGLLYFAGAVFFYKLKVCGNLTLSKTVRFIFPTACVHFRTFMSTFFSNKLFFN